MSEEPEKKENDKSVPEPKKVLLKVLEAYTRDVGRGVARIDYDAMDALDASTGDIIRIKGNKTTFTKALPLYPSDEGRSIVRIDSLIRNNAGININETVEVSKEAVRPILQTIVVKLVPETRDRRMPHPSQVRGVYLVDSLESVAVTKGDHVSIPYFGGTLTYSIQSYIPDVEFGIISRSTSFAFENTAPAGTKTVKYVNTENEVNALLKDDWHVVRYVTLIDRFSPHFDMIVAIMEKES